MSERKPWWLQLAATLIRLNVILLSLLSQSLIMKVTPECNQTRFDEICRDDFTNWELHEFNTYGVHAPVWMRSLYFYSRLLIKWSCPSCRYILWYHSPDGVHYTVLNSSSSKYVIANNRLQINFGNVSASDEGIYGCLDTNIQRDPAGCLRVYGESCFISIRVPYHKAAHHLYALAGSCPCSTSCKYNDAYYNNYYSLHR